MTTQIKKMSDDLKDVVEDLISEYKKVSELYKHAGLNAELKNSALHGMANVLQLKQAAIQNYANWEHIIRENAKFDRKSK
jgi:hypothetical protein